MLNITIKYLQDYLKTKDYEPDNKEKYFLWLIEEVGELARVMRRGAVQATEENIKGTLEEELWDVLYYVLAIANAYDIDMEKWIPIKERQNNEKHGHEGVKFDPR